MFLTGTYQLTVLDQRRRIAFHSHLKFAGHRHVSDFDGFHTTGYLSLWFPTHSNPFPSTIAKGACPSGAIGSVARCLFSVVITPPPTIKSSIGNAADRGKTSVFFYVRDLRNRFCVPIRVKRRTNFGRSIRSLPNCEQRHRPTDLKSSSVTSPE
jgi:hypothetical protein